MKGERREEGGRKEKDSKSCVHNPLTRCEGGFQSDLTAM